MRPKPFVMIVLDGVGIKSSGKGNAVKQAKMPFFNSLFKYPHVLLKAHGEAVGLDKNYIGGSEVGHLHLCSGRIVPQDLKIINDSIRSGMFYRNHALLRAIMHVEKHDSRLHLIGLLSDGGVHSDIGHLIALLKLAKMHDISRVYVHAFLDGRDVDVKSAKKYLAELEKQMWDLRVGKLASMIGRVYAMDRANRQDRTKVAYNLLFNGKGESLFIDPEFAVEKYYKKGFKDEYFPPVVFDKNGVFQEGDAIINFNFRADRARQLMSALDTQKKVKKLLFVGMAPYAEEIDIPFAFSNPPIANTLGEVISRAGLKQLRMAEKEKFTHVTFFANGDSDTQFRNEDRICVPSPRVNSYDLSPKMSSGEITRRLMKDLGKYDFVLINYSNGDMVGHTGNLKAAVRAMEFVDLQLKELVSKIKSLGGEAVIVADHGNCEEMIGVNGEILTSHTRNPVAFIAVSDRKIKLKKGKFGLSNVAPTVLQLMRLKVPTQMKAKSLLI